MIAQGRWWMVLLDVIIISTITTGVPTDKAPVAVILPDAVTKDVNGFIFLNGESSTDDRSIVSYQWTTNELGVILFPPSASVTRVSSRRNGLCNVTLTVTDNDGMTGSASQQLSFTAAPIALIYPKSRTENVKGAMYLNGLFSKDSNGFVVSYRWTTNDPNVNFSLPDGSVTRVSSSTTGQKTVTLSVTDNDGGTGSVTQRLKFTETFNHANDPGAVIVPSTVTQDVNSFIYLNGKLSSSYGGAVWFRWTTDDLDVTFSAPNDSVTTVFTSTPGQKIVTLTVKDNDGLTGSASQKLDFTTNISIAPSAVIDMYPSMIIHGINRSIYLDGLQSTDDGSVVSYRWTTDNPNVTFDSPDEPLTIITSSTSGLKIVTLTVTDNDGLTGSASQQFNFTADPIAPVAVIVASTVLEAVSRFVSLNAHSSIDDGRILSYRWTTDDIDVNFVAPTSPVTNVASRTLGKKTVTLTVRDNDELTGSASIKLTFATAPVAVIFPNTGTENIRGFVDLLGISTSTIYRYENLHWTTEDLGMTFSNPYDSVTRVYADTTGLKTVTLTASNFKGLTGSASRQLNFTAVFGPIGFKPIGFNEMPPAVIVPNKVIQGFNGIIMLSCKLGKRFGVVNCIWSTDDNNVTIGSPHEMLTNVSTSTPGPKIIKLLVINWRRMSASTSIELNFTSEILKAPSAVIDLYNRGVTTLRVNETIILIGEVSTDDGTMMSYRWTADDPGVTIWKRSQTIIELISRTSGSKTVTLTVTDDDGVQGSASKILTIVN